MTETPVGTVSKIVRADSEFVPDDPRDYRNYLLIKFVDPLVCNPFRWGALNSADQTAWVSYRQALLDVPQQSGFPHNITWPTKP